MSVVLNDVQTTVQPLLAQKQLQFHCALDPAVDEIYLDVVKLKQVFLNLLSNAIKFTPVGGAITVRVRSQGPHAFIAEVEDTGIGIQPQDIARLFTAFQQLNEGMAKTQQGTGLGLALTKQMVEAQGGQITVQSAPGHGSIFFFTLPRRMGNHEAV